MQDNKYKHLVSIILPTYNSELFIRETIVSVLSQSYQHFELLIIDDASTDDTPSVITSFSDHRIKFVINDNNRGAGFTRNFALSFVKGDFLCFIDADDLWHFSKLEEQLEHMLRLNCEISHTSYDFICDKSLTLKGSVSASPKVNFDYYLKTTEIGMSSSMINLEKVQDVRFSNMRTRQDTKLWIDLLSRGYVSHGLDRKLMSYRVRSKQISGNKFNMLYRTFRLYMSISYVSKYKMFYYFLKYVQNAILKRF